MKGTYSDVTVIPGTPRQIYRHINYDKTYADAKANCENLGMRLVTIKSSEAFQYITDLGKLVFDLS